MEEEFVEVFSAKDFRKWLNINYNKRKKVFLVIHKKHTGKKFPTHRELIEEAICFGWIDTVVKRIDGDTYLRTFQRRTGKSNWSQNTLSYAKRLVGEGRMTPEGIKFYKEGLKKKPLYHGIPKHPETPKNLERALNKDKTAKKNFEKLSRSKKSQLLRWLLHAKRDDTKKKRIESILNQMNRKK